MSVTTESSSILTRSIQPATTHHDADGVVVLSWPRDAQRREDLADSDQAVLLLVDEDVPAPRCGPREDWVREPADPEEIRARRVSLLARTSCAACPRIDDGLLLFRGGWAAVPPAQVAMAELLVERFGQVARREELTEAAGATGASQHDDAVKAAMGRLGKRLAPLGLELESIRGRGYLLQAAERCPSHDPHRCEGDVTDESAAKS